MDATRSSGERDMTGHVAMAGMVSRGNGRRKPGSTRQLLVLGSEPVLVHRGCTGSVRCRESIGEFWGMAFI